jgi:DNA-binding protein HU-beta
MAPRDKENEMIEELRKRIRRAAANKKPGKQNTPSMLEEMGGRAKISRPKIKDALKGSAKQSKPSMMGGKMTVAEMEAKLKKKAAENKELAATRARAKKAAANKKPVTQVKPSIMKEIQSKTGKATGQGVFASSEKNKKEPAKKTTTAKKAPAPKKSPPAKKDTSTTFKEAFAAARKANKKEFTWKGKKYAAVTKTEVKKSGSKSLREYLNKKSGKAKGK